MRVVTYYLISHIISRSLLIRLRSLKGPYTEKNLIIYIINIFIDFELNNFIGYFISNNISINDITIKAICRDLKFKIAKGYRLRYLNYIINLLIKAFLYRIEEESFNFEILNINKIKIKIY